MLAKSPLKVVIADANYQHYLNMKYLLASRCGSYCNLFWYGSYEHCLSHLFHGHFDLALVEASASTATLLQQLKDQPSHTPVVLMVDAVTRDGAMQASHSGVVGLLDRQSPEEQALAYYLVCAELFHQHELEEGFFANVPVLGRHHHRGYTYIH